jgi:hypothetical protein
MARSAALLRESRGAEGLGRGSRRARRADGAAEGQLQVYERDPSGRELTVAVLEGGASVGATGLVPRAPRELCVRALEPSVYLLPGEAGPRGTTTQQPGGRP